MNVQGCWFPLSVIHVPLCDAGLPGIKPIHVPILRWGLLYRIGMNGWNPLHISV